MEIFTINFGSKKVKELMLYSRYTKTMGVMHRQL